MARRSHSHNEQAGPGIHAAAEVEGRAYVGAVGAMSKNVGLGQRQRGDGHTSGLSTPMKRGCKKLLLDGYAGSRGTGGPAPAHQASEKKGSGLARTEKRGSNASAGAPLSQP